MGEIHQNTEALAITELKTSFSESVLNSNQLEDLKLPSEVLRGLGVKELEYFRIYRKHTRQTFPVLEKPVDDILFFFTANTMSLDRKLKVLSDWASSADGQSLYNQIIGDISAVQEPEQLVLTVAAWVVYRKLVPDRLDNSKQPIKGCYLADLDTHLNGQSLGNSGILSLYMATSLLCALSSSEKQSEDFINFFATVLDFETPPFHVWDGLSNQYWSQRIRRQSHKTAMEEVSQFELPKLTETRQSPIPVYVLTSEQEITYTFTDIKQNARKSCYLCLDNQLPSLFDLTSLFGAHFNESEEGALDIWIDMAHPEILSYLLEVSQYEEHNDRKIIARAWELQLLLHRCRRSDSSNGYKLADEIIGDMFRYIRKLLCIQVTRNLEILGLDDKELIYRTLCDILALHLDETVRGNDKLEDFRLDADNYVHLNIGHADPERMELLGLARDSNFRLDLRFAGSFVPPEWFPSSQKEEVQAPDI